MNSSSNNNNKDDNSSHNSKEQRRLNRQRSSQRSGTTSSRSKEEKEKEKEETCAGKSEPAAAAKAPATTTSGFSAARATSQQRQRQRKKQQQQQQQQQQRKKRQLHKRNNSVNSGHGSLSNLQLCLMIDNNYNNKCTSNTASKSKSKSKTKNRNNYHNSYSYNYTYEDDLSVSEVSSHGEYAYDHGSGSEDDHSSTCTSDHEDHDQDHNITRSSKKTPWHKHHKNNTHSDDSNSTSSSSSNVFMPKFAKEETQKVTRWKTFVMFLLLLDAVLVITITFEFLHQQEVNTFETAFHRAARTVCDASHYHAKSLVQSMQGFSDTITSHTLATQAQWPYVVLPNFERLAQHVKQQAFIEVLAFVPLVTESQRDHWERFATYAAPSWILWESQEQQSHQQSPSQQQPHPTIPARIYQQVNQTNDDPILLPPSNDDNNNNITVNDNYYYAPLWQVSPPPPPKFNKRINVDLFSTQPPLQLATMFQAANRTDFITVSNILDLDWYNDSLHDLLFWGNDSSIHSDHDHEKGAANANANANANQTLGVPIIRSERSPKSVFLQPVYDNFFDEKEEPFDISDNSNNNTLVRQIKGFTLGVLRWEQFYKDLLPLNNDDSDNDDSDNAAAAAAGVHAVLKNTCGQTMTFLIHGPSATFVGVDDLHERRFDDLVVETDLEEFASPQHRHHDKDGDDLHQQGNTCYYHMSLYPSAQFRSAYQTKKTENFTLGMASIFVVTGIAFWIFIYLSKRRQRKVLAVAISSNNIVRSMFPKNVSQIILRDAEEEALRHLEEGDNKRKRYYRRRKKKQHQKSKNTNNFRDDDDENDENYGSHEFTTSGLLSASTHRSSSSLFRSSRPIADLYPEVTVMFADIVAFTAWSSVREPHQVFHLLEAIYGAFDERATKRKVFKVETIGDSYVACAGLPDSRHDHAVVMCRYARDCFSAFDVLIKKLERYLGPETSELSLRIGLHSGPVTAGVLRGQRSRFQLFGDTVNTAAKMESNSKPGYIQISQDTAELLAVSKKSSWFSPREDRVVAKGKGEMQTYWLHPKKDEAEKSEGSSDNDDAALWLESEPRLPELETDPLRLSLSEQNQRLAGWNANQLLKLLNRLMLQRNAKLGPDGKAIDDQIFIENAHQRWAGEGMAIIDEVKDCIEMPVFDLDTFPTDMDAEIKLPEPVIQQLHDYVSIICSMYSKFHPCHNFQHGSHVTMNVFKLLSRIISPPQAAAGGKDSKSAREELYDKTYGIAQDAMTQFAIAFAALVHDVDHPGVRNAQLVFESSRMARIFKNVSVTQQNSFTCAWDLLMDPCFKDLRTTIYTNKEEFDHFRELVVTLVLATDLNDEELRKDRNKRWSKLFLPKDKPKGPKDDIEDVRTCATASSSSSTNSGKKKANSNRRATLIIETIMQASDISHTMQHWHVYRKWNERSFKELCKAFQEGRALSNPLDTWYDDELSFFDNVVIPLAEKMKASGVFDSFSDEYLNFARKNRNEWSRNGKSIVDTMEISFTEKHNDKAPKTPSRQSQEGHGVGPNSSDPLRSMSSSVPEKGQLRILRRSRSNDNIKPDFDDVPTAGCLKRRASVDAAPRTPRRSDTGSLADPFQAVYAMFAKMQDETNAEKRPEGKVDGAPTVPRRSMDNIGSGNIMDEIVNDNENGEDDDDDDGKQVKSRRKSRSSDGAPTAPRRSRDSVEFADILDEVYMMEPFPSSVDNQNGDKSVDNVPPQNLRASRKSDSDNKEFLASTLDVSSSGSVFDSQVEEASLLLQQDHEDDESTVLTMGKLGPLYQTKK